MASRDLRSDADAVNAWPEGWRYEGGHYHDTPYKLTYRALRLRYGQERADAISAGKDEATNADLAAWRQLGSKAA